MQWSSSNSVAEVFASTNVYFCKHSIVSGGVVLRSTRNIFIFRHENKDWNSYWLITLGHCSHKSVTSVFPAPLPPSVQTPLCSWEISQTRRLSVIKWHFDWPPPFPGVIGPTWHRFDLWTLPSTRQFGWRRSWFIFLDSHWLTAITDQCRWR